MSARGPSALGRKIPTERARRHLNDAVRLFTRVHGSEMGRKGGCRLLHGRHARLVGPGCKGERW